jgi:L-lactate dehydrogenase complex protein LldG
VRGSRQEILARIGLASPRPSRPALGLVERRYRRLAGEGDLELFAERVADYKATVCWATPEDVTEVLSQVLASLGARRIGIPEGLPASWVPPGLELVADNPPLPPSELDALDAVLTTCSVAIAETGTVILDHGPGQGRRALTLVPDRHVVVVPSSSVVAGVPDAVALLDPSRPQTWISGPSATSDIELNRVEGVHGPRILAVVILTS